MRSASHGDRSGQTETFRLTHDRSTYRGLCSSCGACVASCPVYILQIEGSETLNVPLKETEGFARSNCAVCDDFTAEFADISVGGVGCTDGWSTVIARTARGQDFIAEAEKSGWLELKPIDLGKHGMEQVLRLSAAKKTLASKPQVLTALPPTPQLKI